VSSILCGMKQEMLTCGEVGREVGLVPASIRAAERAGRIRATIRTAGGLRLFSRAEVERFKRDREAGREQASAGR